MKTSIFKTIFLLLITLNIQIILSAQSAKYTVEKGAIVGKNAGSFNNRPLYVNNSDAFILTGDRPIARLAKDQFIYGAFMLAAERNGKSKWLHHFSRITSAYRPGRMLWEVTDPLFPGLKIVLEILPMSNTTGMTVCARAEGATDGTRLIWAFGGAQWLPGQNLAWRFDVTRAPKLLEWEFAPEECKNNKVEKTGDMIFLSLPDSTNNKIFSVSVSCSATTGTGSGNASAWKDPVRFQGSESKELPLIKGTIPLETGKRTFWAFEAFNAGNKPGLSKVSDPATVFADGVKRTDSFEDRLRINTPDPYLNAVARASVAAIDGTWYPPVFVHGAMAWSVRFPGWRTIFGGTMYGWHDRVMDEARFYTESQVRESDKKEAKADPKTLMTEQHPDSRFYGLGHISKDQNFYDMQTQFFDQIIEEYRWTADPELVKFFREALELHLIWIRDCFDPDGDGVYESYINVWPTDSQWYNGGGTAEETSYAYRGHLAARDMARNAGDREAEDYHNKMLEKIRKGFFEKLWIRDKGFSGSYREQGGHERLHENPWLYSIFLPVDAGLTSQLQAIESVYYSEWALENVPVSSGGRKVWTSNWVPHVWSVRELWPGDNYHLALSYYRAGLPEDAWEIMRGSFMYSAFEYGIPGNLGDVHGGIDFGDCIHPFSRTLVSGLFGYNPDYPNKKVKISPQFPVKWDHASIEVPDVKISFTSSGNKADYSFELARAADLELFLPVQCEEIKNVTVNGNATDWELLPGAGRSLLHIQLPDSEKTKVSFETGNPLPYYDPVSLEANIGESVQLMAKDARIKEYEDPQSVLKDEKIENGILKADITGNKGYHTVVVRAVAGKAPQLRIFRIRVNDPEGDALQKTRIVHEIPPEAGWETVDIRPLLNADVTKIYQQEYLSPRPNTVSARLGTDGYSPWTFWHWKTKLPVIKTDNVINMLDNKNRLNTPQGVPFLWYGEGNNISFTSMWDNYPARIDFPVNRTGSAAFFLVSGSTNVMQCQIANAVIRLHYADGLTDSLELVPPINYWNLSTISTNIDEADKDPRNDYTSETDRFCLPAKLPERVQLGENCRAMLLNLKLRPGVVLKSITLETLSQEVVVGLMGITLMKN